MRAEPKELVGYYGGGWRESVKLTINIYDPPHNPLPVQAPTPSPIPSPRRIYEILVHLYTKKSAFLVFYHSPVSFRISILSV